jgi:GT2 family glycosyltransferase
MGARERPALILLMAADEISVIGVVAAYRRPECLCQLLASLHGSTLLAKVVVVDNGRQEAIAAVCSKAPMPVVYDRPASNLGCGGGVARGLQLALAEGSATHFCLFDDDAEATPGAVDRLVRGMQAASACIAVPLVLNEQDYVSWVPGLENWRAMGVIKRPRLAPADFYRLCGTDPVPFSWSPWPVMALSAAAVREKGYPREDFWVCAEDIEYSLRLTYHSRGVLVPQAVCRHLPPAASSGNELDSGHYLRFCLLLQNVAYLAMRLPHGRRAARHLPAVLFRFLLTFGLKPAVIRDALAAGWRGAIRGKPAGSPGFDEFKRRFLRLKAVPLKEIA